MYKLEVTLKQHTPLIHFQHDQEGATLRASEVKPKLDKFILTKLGTDNFIVEKALKIVQKRNPNIIGLSHDEAARIVLNRLGWLTGKSYALNYRLRISTTDNYRKFLLATFLSKKQKHILESEHKEYISPCPCFGDEEKFGLLWNDDIKLTFISYNSDILELIKENVISFFVYSNFGFRQSKGFGCFSVISINNEEINMSKHIDIIQTGEKYAYYKTDTNDLSSKFQLITNDYQILKSGRNTPTKTYKKSKLFEYMLYQYNLRWEKRKIKLFLKNNYPEVFNDLKYNSIDANNNIVNDEEESGEERFVFARALLGLADHIEFRTFENRGYTKDKIKIKISEVSRSIERFKSPLIFKIYGSNIYIIVENINEAMYNKEFVFKLSYEHNNREVNVDIFSLRTPHSDQFDFIEFLDSKLISIGWKKL